MGCVASTDTSKEKHALSITTKELENVLRNKYGFTGSFKDTTFRNTTNDSFKQLADVLRKTPIEKSVKDDKTIGRKTDIKVNNSLVKSHIKNDGFVPAKSVTTCPKIGDIAFVYWHGYGWFTAKIIDWLPNELSYMIKWTDGNWAPEKARYNDLCVDNIPDASTIGVGTKVLLYYCGLNNDGSVCDDTGRSLSNEKKKEIAEKGQASDRWHMGIVTRTTKDNYGVCVYTVAHVGEDDPQRTKGDYVGYKKVLESLSLEDLRTPPNIYNCLDSSNVKNIEHDMCDIFLSKVPEDNSSVNRIEQYFINKYRISKSDEEDSSQSLQKTVGNIKTCKVYLVCLSDNFILSQQAMSELLYAKKTLGKPVIPLVLGESSKWSETTAGMLLAGQLYIQFRSPDIYQEKIVELECNLEKLAGTNVPVKIVQVKEVSSEQKKRIFLSYSWSNSKNSFDLGQVKNFKGNLFSDPRQIKIDIEKNLGEKVWLDIEQLDSVDDSGMFGQIAQGLTSSSVVIICVSKEYVNSQNCQMEANFALRSLHKKSLVIEVGSGNNENRKNWNNSSIGKVLPRDGHFVMTPEMVCNSEEYDATINQICKKLKNLISLRNTDKEIGSSLRASVPLVGDSVIAFYGAWQFFPAKVVSFDKKTMKYIVDWDDPDPSCRDQPYNLVAVNRTPNENEIGTGTRVLFKQGTYSYGSSTGDVWNLGEITSIKKIDGQCVYSGKHSKTEADGLAVASWASFKPTFENLHCYDLRLFPNAIEMLEAYKNIV